MCKPVQRFTNQQCNDLTNHGRTQRHGREDGATDTAKAGGGAQARPDRAQRGGADGVCAARRAGGADVCRAGDLAATGHGQRHVLQPSARYEPHHHGVAGLRGHRHAGFSQMRRAGRHRHHAGRAVGGRHPKPVQYRVRGALAQLGAAQSGGRFPARLFFPQRGADADCHPEICRHRGADLFAGARGFE